MRNVEGRKGMALRALAGAAALVAGPAMAAWAHPGHGTEDGALGAWLHAHLGLHWHLAGSLVATVALVALAVTADWALRRAAGWLRERRPARSRA